METAVEASFLDYSARKLEQLAGRLEDCLMRLTPPQIWARGGENENAVGNLVLHLCGNVRQWIVAGVGGAADTRDRDSEFTARGPLAAAELANRLRAVVAEAAAVIRGVPAEGLTRQLRIQKYEVTVLEAVYHVVEHFAGHTGQILFATKLLTGADLDYYRHLRGGAEHREGTP